MNPIKKRMEFLSSLLQPGRFFQFLATLSASLLAISDSMVYGWSSPVIPILESPNTPIQIGEHDSAWLEAMYMLAGLTAVPVIPLLIDKLGRHKSILLCSFLSILGWIVIGIATRVEILYIGRFILGAITDITYTTVPVYISEIADKEIRGFLNGFVYIMMYIGLILIYSVAPSTPLYVPSVVIVVILLLQIVTFCGMPESPYFWVKKQNYEKAKNCLKRLRSKDKCDTELEEIRKSIKQNQGNCNLKEALLSRSSLKGFTCMTILSLAQHFCGFSVILMNLYSILEKADSTYLDSNTTEILFAVMMLVIMCVTCNIIDKFGRRVLLIWSSILTGVNLLGLAVYFHVKSLGIKMDYLSWLPIAIVMFYAITFTIGLGLVPKVLATELFPIRVKAIGVVFGDAMYVIFGALSILSYKYMIRDLEMYVPFYIFSGIAFVATILVILVIPETKGKSLEEIQIMLEND